MCPSVRPTDHPSVCLSLTVRVFLDISYITQLGKFLEVTTPNIMCGHMIWKRGGVTFLEVATQLGKVPAPIIMYGHMMAEGGGELKIV